jgi:site-specific DNA-methyltransferase (adenine-specific)
MQSLTPESCDLIYLDPPFGSGRKRLSRSPRAAGDGFDDVWSRGITDWLAFMEPRLRACHALLRHHGTLYLHSDWRTSHYARAQLDTIFGAENFLNEIIWHYRTGGVSKRWFARKHDTILVYARARGKHRFHVLREGTYRTDGLMRDETGRPYKQTRKGRLYFHSGGPALTDVWDVPFLSTVSSERAGWPTQKPLALMKRVIQASSNPGDLVADFFCGSGTTLVAARQLGRQWLGCDLSQQAVGIAQRRIESANGGDHSFANRSRKRPS